MLDHDNVKVNRFITTEMYVLTEFKTGNATFNYSQELLMHF